MLQTFRKVFKRGSKRSSIVVPVSRSNAVAEEKTIIIREMDNAPTETEISTSTDSAHSALESPVTCESTFAMLALPRELRDQIIEAYLDMFINSSDKRILAAAAIEAIPKILNINTQLRREALETLTRSYIIEFEDLPGMTTFDRRKFSGMRMSLELPLETKHAWLETLYDFKDHFANHLREYERLVLLASLAKSTSEARRAREHNRRIDEAMRHVKNRIVYTHLDIEPSDDSVDIEIVKTEEHYRITGKGGWVVDVMIGRSVNRRLGMEPSNPNMWVILEGHLAHIGCLWLRGQSGDEAVRSFIKNSLQRTDLDRELYRLGFGKPRHSIYAWDAEDCNW